MLICGSAMPPQYYLWRGARSVRGRRYELGIELSHRVRNVRPAEALDGFAGGASERRAQLVVVEQQLQPLGERLRAAPRNEIAGLAIADRAGETADPRSDDRRAARHRFHRDHAEALVVRRHDADVRGVVVLRQLLVLDGADELDVVVDAEARRQLLELRHLCFGA